MMVFALDCLAFDTQSRRVAGTNKNRVLFMMYHPLSSKIAVLAIKKDFLHPSRQRLPQNGVFLPADSMVSLVTVHA